MTPDAFTEILRKITGYTEHIYLHVLGEPLLHPDLGLLFDISKTYGFHVNLTTNGTLLAQKGKLLLSKSALRQVNVSLHSIEQSRSLAALHLYLDGVLAFIREAGSSPSLFINLRLWNLHRDASDLNERILERLASFFKLPAPIFGNDAPSLPLAPRVFLSRDRRFVWPHAPAPDLGSHGRCRGLRDHIAILVDGTVVPCCLDAEADIPLGNILAGRSERKSWPVHGPSRCGRDLPGSRLLNLSAAGADIKNDLLPPKPDNDGILDPLMSLTTVFLKPVEIFDKKVVICAGKCVRVIQRFYSKVFLCNKLSQKQGHFDVSCKKNRSARPLLHELIDLATAGRIGP